MSTPPSELFTNHLNSPFSAPQADRTENVGLEAILIHVANLRDPNLPADVSLIGGIFAGLGSESASAYTPQRRAQLMQHYEGYLARIHIFEEVIRAESLVRYLVRRGLASSPHIPRSRELANIEKEQGNLLESMLDLVDSLAALEEANGSPMQRTNATLVRRLVQVADAVFFDPLINFRNRIAHGYSRAFHTGLRRRGMSKISDLTATQIFNQADLVSAQCIVENLQRLSLIYYRLPQALAATGTLFSPALLEEARLHTQIPQVHAPRWLKKYGQRVRAMTCANLRHHIEAPEQALQSFWALVKT